MRWNGTRKMPDKSVLIGNTRVVPLGPVLPGSDLHEFVLDREGIFVKFFAHYQSVTFGENNSALLWSVNAADELVQGRGVVPEADAGVLDAIESALVALGIPEDSGLPGDSRIATRLPKLRGASPRPARILAQWPIFSGQAMSLNLPVGIGSRDRLPLYPESGKDAWFHITKGDAYILFSANWTGKNSASRQTTWHVGEMISWPGSDPEEVASLRHAIVPALQKASPDITGETVPVAVEFAADAVSLHKGFLVIDERLLPEGENRHIATSTGIVRHPVAYDRDAGATFAYRDRTGYDPRENTPEDGIYSYTLLWRNRTFHAMINERSRDNQLSISIPINMLYEKETVVKLVLAAFDAFRTSDRSNEYSQRIHPDSVFSGYSISVHSPVFVSESEPGAIITARTEKMDQKSWSGEGNPFPPETPIFMHMELAGRFVECEASYRFADDSRPGTVEWTVHNARVPGGMISDSWSIFRDNKDIHASRAPWLSRGAFISGLEEFTRLAIPGAETVSIQPFTASAGKLQGPAFNDSHPSNLRVAPFAYLRKE